MTARSVRPALNALVFLTLLAMGLAAFPARAQSGPAADLGDAPDSSNHSSTPMPAYAGVAARFPTVFDGPAPAGPLHRAAKSVWLGPAVTAETEADQGPDEDQLTNIAPGDPRPANRDGADDGWLNQATTVFRDCSESFFEVGVRRNLDQSLPADRLFLNVWYDGNRDGDWADSGPCESDPTRQRVAFEWIVQNFPIDPQLLANGGESFKVPSFLVLDRPNPASPNAEPWVRFTLSELPVPRGPDGAPADGRGPPNGFALGETEDYRYAQPTQSEPGQLVITKTARVEANTVRVGDELTYFLTLQHQAPAGAPSPAPLFARAIDLLPPEVELIGGPIVAVDGPTSAPFAIFDPAEGPSGAVRWEGSLGPGSFIGIEFKVRVRFCSENDRVIRNELRAQAANADPQTAVSELLIDCQPPEPPPDALLTKGILLDGAERPRVEASLPLGEELTYILSLGPTAGLSETVRLSDTLPLGLVAVEAGASLGRAAVIEEGRTVIWEGPRSEEPVTVKIRARLTENARCGERLVNTAFWFTDFHRGASNPAALILTCDDLGDAPDSSNHFNVKMPAYPGVDAGFPTVFDDPGARGPKHVRPRPLHLGRGVSSEIEADVGPDTDGPNNIIPRKPQDNLDRYDDGLAVGDLKFAPCEPARVPVFVSAAPGLAALLPENNATVYLNVWVDGNRDGDWADSLECPNRPAREHIVIDFPIDVSTLGPGPQPVIAPTSGPVPWPATLAQRPAWLRVTLSERPANKLLPTGCAGAACTHGDGRGYAQPFRLGETEDYLLLGRAADGKADPTVKKDGSIVPAFSPQTNERAWIANWAVEYYNAGSASAEDVVLVDTLQGPQTRTEREFSAPPLTPVVSGPTATYSPGSMLPGQVGFIGFQTTVPFNTPPGVVLTNTVTISASNDIDPTNNTAVVSLTVPLLPPVILDPISGETCSGEVTVRGVAQAGSSVQLYVDGAASGAPISPAADGSWEATVNLAAGDHALYAVATQAGVSSQPSPAIEITVDPTLSWSPISLRFTDQDGHVFVPRDENGRASETGWRVWLRPNTSYTVSVRICCDDPAAVVTIEIPGVGTVSLTESATEDNLFEGSFTTGERTGLANGTFSLCVTCNLIRRCSDGTVLIDPLGVVYDALKGPEAGLLAGATVACYEQTGGTRRLWPAAQFGQVNPQTTGADGFYSFYTPPGTYQLEVTREGYHPFRSERILVTDAPVIYNVPLTPLPEREADYTVYITENGFEPAVLRVPKGAVVRWVNLTGEPRSTRGETGDSQGLAATSGWDSGLLNSGDSFGLTFDGTGTYTVSDPTNPLASATVVVDTTSLLYLPALFK